MCPAVGIPSHRSCGGKDEISHIRYATDNTTECLKNIMTAPEEIDQH
jgi:hypothetical protein